MNVIKLIEARKILTHPSVFIGLLAALTCYIYFQSIHAPFIYDDIQQIQSNINLHDSFNLKHVIFNGLRMERPLLNIIYSWAWRIGGGETWSFHLVNILLHLMNGFLVFQLLNRWFVKNTWITGMTLSLFLLHPLQIQAVTYVMGLVSSLQCFFVLLALYLYVESRGYSKLLFILLSISLWVKPSCVFIPLFLLSYDLTLGKKHRKKVNWGLFFLFQGLLVIQCAIMNFYLQEQSQLEAVGFHLFPVFEYCVTQFYYVCFYLRLGLNPNLQSLIHEYPRFSNEIGVWGFVGFSIMVGLGYACFKTYRRLPGFTFALLFFVLTMAPTNGPFQMVNPFAEYRLYQANLALFVVFSIAYFQLFQRLNLKKMRTWTASILILYFALFTYGEQKTWNHPLELYLEGLELYPRSMLLNLGAGYYFDEQNKRDEGERYLLLALEISQSSQNAVQLRDPRNFLLDHYLKYGQNEKADIFVREHQKR